MDTKKECAAGDEGEEEVAGPTGEAVSPATGEAVASAGGATPAEEAAGVTEDEIVSTTVTPGTNTQPPTDDSAPGTDTEGEKETDEKTITENAPEKIFGEDLLENLNNFLTSQYAFDILKCTLLFVLAIKLANDCSNIALPLKYYRPFH